MPSILQSRDREGAVVESPNRLAAALLPVRLVIAGPKRLTMVIHPSNTLTGLEV